MKIGKRWPLYLLLIVVGVLGTRLAWRLNVSETGWTPHLDHWANVTTSLFGVEHRELGDQAPAEQAKFWLSEVKRVRPADDDPEVAMGAAWMLDSPQFGFIRRHVRMKEGEAGNCPNLLTPKLILRQWSLAHLEDIHEDHPHLRSADEAANVSKHLAEVQRELKFLEEVGRRMAARAGTSGSEVSLGTTATVQRALLSVFLMTTAQMLVIVCVALALMSSLISLLVGRNDDADQVTFGLGRHIVAWLIAVGISFILLGMVPAEIVSASVQTWLVYGAIWIGFGAVFLGLLYRFGTQFTLPAGQVAGLAIVISSPIIAVAHSANPASKVNGRTAWLCRCDCGTETVKITKYLRNGDTTSCGCAGKHVCETKHGLANKVITRTNVCPVVSVPNVRVICAGAHDQARTI